MIDIKEIWFGIANGQILGNVYGVNCPRVPTCFCEEYVCFLELWQVIFETLIFVVEIFYGCSFTYIVISGFDLYLVRAKVPNYCSGYSSQLYGIKQWTQNSNLTSCYTHRSPNI